MPRILTASIVLLSASLSWAGVGDPQTKTDHPWYPGELSCSTFERLFQTQNELYTRVTGRKTDSDEDKALAAWYWRNLNFHHTCTACEDLTDDGWDPKKNELDWRDFWTGQFANGFGICFTTHHQLCAEFEKLFGPGRSRICGIGGHTSHEVWLTGGAYGEGRWALLDHDISTVIFTPNGERLMSLSEVADKKYGPAAKATDTSRGWMPNGLHSSDSIFSDSKFVGYSTGYAGIPPVVYLRSGESLRATSTPAWRMGRPLPTGASTTTPAAFPARTATKPGSASPRTCSRVANAPAGAAPATVTPCTSTGPTSSRLSTRKPSLTRPAITSHLSGTAPTS